MQIFARLTKVNEADRTVEGIIASEALDKSGEIFDYERSVPHFKAWSEGIAKATEGKSLGNVRVMHGNQVAGVTKALNFDDTAKQITVKAEIVDDNEWNKVKKGCYTGFSIGGKYGSKWEDPVAKAQRYEAIPNEYSLVDLPCNPQAQFTVIKADGSSELRKFETSVDDAEALQKWVDSLPDEQRDMLAKIAKRPDVSPKEGEHKYGDVKFADEKNKKYPIDTPAHIRAAWNYINKPKNAAKYDGKDLRAIKARIVSAWKEKIDKAGPPSAEKDDAAKGEGLARADSRAAGLLAKMDQAEPLLRTVRAAYGHAPLEKGLYTVSMLAELLCNLDNITVSSEMEAEWEGDNSAVPGELRSIVKELAGVLLDMADEEVEELVANYEKSTTGDLSKSATSPEEDSMNDELKKGLDEANENLAKVTGERDELKKALDKAATEIAERDELLVKAAAAIDERNEVIKKFQNAPAPVKAALMAVAKGEDIGDASREVEQVKKADGTVDEAATAIKKALMNPVVTR